MPCIYFFSICNIHQVYITFSLSWTRQTTISNILLHLKFLDQLDVVKLDLYVVFQRSNIINCWPHVLYGCIVSGNQTIIILAIGTLVLSFRIKWRDEIFDLYSLEQRNILILDDPMILASLSTSMTDLFTKESHYKNRTVIYLVKNVNNQGKIQRTISLNLQYSVIFW